MEERVNVDGIRRWWVGLSGRARLIVVAVVVVAVLALIGSLGGNATENGSSAGDGATDDGGEGISSRCETASSALVEAIGTGLTVDGGGSLANAHVVRSDDFENAYFVGARIEGEGMDNVVGVWSTNDPDGGGSIFAANAVAQEFSDWGPGPGFSPSDDGFTEARDCAEG